MNTRPILATACALLLFAAACGEGEQKPSDAGQRAAAQPERDYGLNPLDLRGDRYFKEMIREEVESVYFKQPGEFIDPQRIIELLDEIGSEPEDLQPLDTAGEQISRRWGINDEVHQEALKRFEAGDLAGAVGRWEDVLTGRQAFTLSVEVDCDTSILQRAFSLLQALDAPVFVLPVSVGDRVCHRVCLGVFSSRSEAGEWIGRVKSRLPESHPFVFVVR